MERKLSEGELKEVLGGAPKGAVKEGFSFDIDIDDELTEDELRDIQAGRPIEAVPEFQEQEEGRSRQ